MSDRGIGQQPADVALPEGADVADGHRQHGQYQSKLPAEIARCGNRHEGQAHQTRDAGDLRGDGQEPGIEICRSLINVRSIELKRRRGQLESKSGDEQDQGQRGETGQRAGLIGEAGDDLANAAGVLVAGDDGCPGNPVDERKAI